MIFLEGVNFDISSDFRTSNSRCDCFSPSLSLWPKIAQNLSPFFPLFLCAHRSTTTLVPFSFNRNRAFKKKNISMLVAKLLLAAALLVVLVEPISSGELAGSGSGASAPSGGGASAAPPPLEQVQILNIVTNCLLKPWPQVQEALQNCTTVPANRIVLFGPPTICDIDTNVRNYTAILTLVGAESPNDPAGPVQRLVRSACSRYLVYRVIQMTPDAAAGLSPPEATTLMWVVTGVVVVGVFGVFFLTILRRISFVAQSKRQLREFFSSEPMSELKNVVDEEASRTTASSVPPALLRGHDGAAGEDRGGDDDDGGGVDKQQEAQPLTAAPREKGNRNPVDLL